MAQYKLSRQLKMIALQSFENTIQKKSFTRLNPMGWIGLTLTFHQTSKLLFYSFDLADELKEGQTQTFYEWVLCSLRKADDPAIPVGPPWLREAGLDLTALDSPVFLLVVLLAVIGFMWLKEQ